MDCAQVACECQSLRCPVHGLSLVYGLCRITLLYSLEVCISSPRIPAAVESYNPHLAHERFDLSFHCPRVPIPRMVASYEHAQARLYNNLTGANAGISQWLALILLVSHT